MKQFQKFSIVSIAALLLASCVNVDSKVAEKPSRYWKAPADAKPERILRPAQILTDKIVDESDTLPASDKMLAGETLDLSDLIVIALENNTLTRQYWFQAKVYAAQKGSVDSQYLPRVSANVGVARVKTRQYGVPPAVGTFWNTGYGPSLQINWLLYDFGKRGRLSESAREALRAANFDYNQSLQDIVLAVNLGYFNLYNAQGYVKTAKANLADAQESYKAAKAKLDNGVGNRPDELRALATLKNAEFELERANAAIEGKRAELAKVLGIEVTSSLKISDEFVVPSSDTTNQEIDSLVADALRERQSLMAAYAKIRAAEYKTFAQENNYLPSLSGVVDLQWQDFTNDRYEHTPYNNYSIGLALSWSLFEGFNKQYQVIGARAQERIAAQQLKDEQISIIGDVWSSFYSYKSAQKQLTSAQSALDASQEAFNAIKSAYDNGVSTLTDLLNAQTQLAMARQQLIDAEAFLSVSIAKLAHSTGTLTNNVPAEILGERF